MATGTGTRTRPADRQAKSQAQPDKARQTQPKQRQQPSRTQQRFAGLQRLARETYSETKKITWPDKETTRNLTLVVIAISIVLGLVLGGVDAAFVHLWNLIP